MGQVKGDEIDAGHLTRFIRLSWLKTYQATSHLISALCMYHIQVSRTHTLLSVTPTLNKESNYRLLSVYFQCLCHIKPALLQSYQHVERIWSNLVVSLIHPGAR